MAVINKQFVLFVKKATLQKHLDANEILPTSIVFVKETGEIYVNGQYYTNYNQTEANTTAISEIQELSGWWIEPDFIPTKVWYKDGSYLEFDIKNSIYCETDYDHMPNYLYPTSMITNVENAIKIEISTEVNYIGNQVFRGCSLLLEVILPKNIKSIGEGAFEGCTSLILVVIPNEVTKLGLYGQFDGMFRDCTNLKSVVLPNNLNYIGGGGVFYNCPNLTSVTYKGVTYTSKSALENTLIENGVTIYDNYLFNTTGLSD